MTVEDAKAYLKDDVGYSEEQLATLNATQLKKLADGLMRQSDYDSALNEEKGKLAKAQADLDAKNERLNAEMAEWATVQRQGGEVTAKMQRDMEALQAGRAAAIARIQNLAQQAGMDPTKALEGLDSPVPPTPQPTPQPQGLSQADVQRMISESLGGLASGILDVPAELATLADEHKDLYGKTLDQKAIVAEIKARASTRGNTKPLDPRLVWEEMHKVPERRREKDLAEREAAIKSARDEGYQAALSERHVPGSTSAPGHRAPIFGGKPESALKRPQPGGTVRSASDAFRSGKYRQGKSA